METVTIAGITFRVVSTPAGAGVDSDDPRVKPLARLVNAVFDDTLPELRERLEAGGQGARHGFHAIRPAGDPDDPPLLAARQAWRALTGEDPGDDVLIVGVPYLPGEIAVPRGALIEILDGVEALRAGRRRATPAFVEAAGPAYDPLADLEQRAMDLDDQADAARSVEDRARVAARRALLLEDLEAAGILDPARLEDPALAAAVRPFASLERYHQAARALAAYYAGDARRAIGGAPPSRLVGGPVSIDWFRRPTPPPAGVDPYAWLAACEQALRDTSTDGGEGTFYYGRSGSTYVLTWRKDDGTHPALVTARRRDLR